VKYIYKFNVVKSYL